MSDDTLALRTLLAAIDGLPAGAEVTIDLIRDECDAAALTSAEKSGAFRTACSLGYLDGHPSKRPDGRLVVESITSTHPAGKGRLVRLYARTSKPIPGHLCRLNAPSVVPGVSIENEQEPHS